MTRYTRNHHARHIKRNGTEWRAVLYGRVSVDKSGQGRSTTEQLNDMRRDAERRGWIVVAEVEDVNARASAYKRDKRPAWDEAAELIATGEIDVLMLWEHSRAGRSMELASELQNLLAEHDTLLSYSGQVFDLRDGDDRFRFAIDAATAARESSSTSKRVTRSRVADASYGRAVGQTPFGFQRIFDATNGGYKTQVMDPVNGPIVQAMVRRVLAGESLRSIATELNDNGTPSVRGAKWSNTVVRQIVVNPAYAALRVHRGEIIGPGAWQAIISIEDHDAAVALLSDPARRLNKQNKRVHLLSGVARCAVCNNKLFSQAHSVNGVPGYACRNGGHVTMRAALLDALVIGRLFDRFTNEIGDIDIEPSKDVVNARAEIQRLETLLNEARESMIGGDMSVKQFNLMEARVVADIERHRRTTKKVPVPTTVDGLSAADDPKVFWDSLTVEQQTAIVRALLTIRVNPGGVKGWSPPGATPSVHTDRVEMVWVA